MTDQRVSTQSHNRVFSLSCSIQHASKFMRAKICVNIRKELNSNRTGLGQQHHHRFFVLNTTIVATVTSCEDILFSFRFYQKHHVFPSGFEPQENPSERSLQNEGELIRYFKDSGSTYKRISFTFSDLVV